VSGGSRMASTELFPFRLNAAISIALAAVTACIFLVSGFTLLSLSSDGHRDSAKLDWHDEIRWMEAVLNGLVPAAVLLVGVRFMAVLKTKERSRMLLLLSEGIGAGCAVFVAISVWSLLASSHLPEIDLWKNGIWWR